MDQSGIHIGDVGQIMRRMVDEWRLDERKSIRGRLNDFEDHFDRLEGRVDQSDTQDQRHRLQESHDLYKSQLDDRYAMIEKAHRQMVEYLDMCRQGAE